MALVLLKPVGRGPSGWAGADQVIRVQDSLDYFSRRVKVDSKDSFAFAMLGLLRADRNEHELAASSYDLAIRLDPQSGASFTGRAGSWLALREYDKAIADCDRAIVLDSKNSESYLGRGLVHLRETSTRRRSLI